MKVNYEPNPSSAIIIKRKKGLSVSNQQLKVNIFSVPMLKINKKIAAAVMLKPNLRPLPR